MRRLRHRAPGGVVVRAARRSSLYLLLLLTALSGAADEPAEEIRPPAVAGAFYPADRAKLDTAVRAYLEEARPPRGPRPLALVAPHAGLVYSGQIAADAWRQVQGADIDTVVLLAVNHTTAPFRGVSVSGLSGYRTPLGVVEVDRDLAAAIAAAFPKARFIPEAHAREHSEEVQLPFLQVALPKAKVVPCVLGDGDAATAAAFGRALARVLTGRRALVLASTDLSHYPTYGDAVAVDHRTLEAAASLDPEALAAAVQRSMARPAPALATCACGLGPLLATLHAAKGLGAQRGAVLSYANSGDTVFGEYGRVVGYGALAFYGEAGAPDTAALALPEAGPERPLDEAEKRYLLRLARQTLSRYYSTGTVPMPRPPAGPLWQARGCFVTLERGGDLRGCIGHMAQDTPLALAVARMALQAALRDTRFKPVLGEELAGLEIEISALTPARPVEGPGAVVVGRDGVLLQKGSRGAVFLPQVAPEQGWGREELLGHLCEKAGLDADCWRTGATLQTFRAEVFSESELKRRPGGAPGR